ncbi:hypothetical protein JCM18904_4985 [Vibrio sp. JCM 18904]|nr:hypothetical protein JCM18904_4985 [Vibrio sp. JCM 18904]
MTLNQRKAKTHPSLPARFEKEFHVKHHTFHDLVGVGLRTPLTSITLAKTNPSCLG